MHNSLPIREDAPMTEPQDPVEHVEIAFQGTPDQVIEFLHQRTAVNFEEVLAAARVQFLTLWPDEQTEAAFDFGLAKTESNSWQALKNAVWHEATRGMEGESTEDQQREFTALWEELQPAIDAYAAECRGRKYTGWSAYSKGPIQYGE
jgi:hypothetical protein